MVHVSRAPHGGLALGVGAFGAAVWAQREPVCHRWHLWRTRRVPAPAGDGEDPGLGSTGVREPRRPLPHSDAGAITLDEP